MKTDELLHTLSPTTRERALLIAKRLMNNGIRNHGEALKIAIEMARRWAWRNAATKSMTTLEA
ncbi:MULTISPECIES: hypothetical protein [unclassified Siphonobacter]|uniref:hypothetical protein n=1 Tax=unclassified Siphonobacter TaxID=2635712 RepID=UPI000CC0F082|nr:MULTISPECIES: hypothetical protein [unclassified Siphonobacter]MDQ1086853.1 uncharacterized protein YdaT [Siphonobacter sp. SORGH_AS_1065]PKK35747.1 hypothetical protein BWI96_15705 [Siphonobacter sp. SORGH_AS_0500]